MGIIQVKPVLAQTDTLNYELENVVAAKFH